MRRLQRTGRLLGRGFTRAVNDTTGVAAVEFGLMIPLFGLMLISVADIGMSVHRKMQVEQAAQVGVQYAMVHGFDASAISAAVVSASEATAITATPSPTKFCGCVSGSSISTVTCGSTCPGGARAGTYTTVSAQASYSTILDYRVVPVVYTFNAQSTARLQ
jgi:Flp pilus assembly protein TadG